MTYSLSSNTIHESIPVQFHEALLAYLNLPPVGCIADNNPLFEINSNSDQYHYEIPKQKRELLLKMRKSLGGSFNSLSDLQEFHNNHPQTLLDIVERLRDVTRYGNRITAAWGGPESYKAYMALLDNARSYIHISTYILGGSVGIEIIRLLEKKMFEGVEVRLLFCASGLVLSGSPSGTGFVSRLSGLRSFLVNDMYSRKALLQELRKTAVPFLDSSPIGYHWRRKDMRQRGIDSRESYYRWTKECKFPLEWITEQQSIDTQCQIGFINVDHRKFTIVDGRKAFIGSQNLADSYFYTNELHEDPAVNRRNWQWHDGSCILEGGAVHQLSDMFAKRWWLSGGDQFDYTSDRYKPEPKRVGNTCVTITQTNPGLVNVPISKNLGGLFRTVFGGRPPLLFEGTNPIREWLKIIPKLAKNSLIAQHCYPSDRELLLIWGEEASRLEELVMIVPNHYDVLFLGMECDSNHPSLLESGVQLYGYDRAIMHSKIIVLDGFYTVTGSYNLNVRSSRADMECSFYIQCSEFGQQMRAQLEEDIKQSQPISPSKLSRFRSRFSIPVIDMIFRYFLF